MTSASGYFRNGLIAAVLLASAPAFAQSQNNLQNLAPGGESVAGVAQGPASALLDDQRGTSGKRPTLLQDQRAGVRPAPFGSELFTGGGGEGGASQIDPNYVLRPGDQITVSTFGAVNESQQLTVDAAGMIVVPNVGPLKVEGLTAGEVNGAISRAAGRVYQSTVKVYASAVASAKTQVFVTGPVLKPGGQQGSGLDSVVGFLQHAGGIDPNRGSYRHILLRRGGRTLTEVDLYDFLLNGDITDIPLRTNDVIVVGQQGPVVSVSGDARAPYTFEFKGQGGTGQELLRYARPRPEVTHVSVLGTREGKPYNAYLTRAEFAAFRLFDGDRVGFEADAPADTFVVRIEGAQNGPSAFTVRRGETLGPLLARIPLDPLADTPMIHLERQSVAAAQRQLLQESLARLEKAIYTTSSSTSAVAAARQADAAGLQQFINRARSVQPRGLVSLPENADLNTVMLEPDDVIVIPYQSQVVVIAGEVELPQTLLWTPGGDAKDYVERAGGYAPRANRGDTLVIHPDGSTARGGPVRQGDRILVPPKLSGQFLAVVRDVTQIMSQLAITGLALFR
ncbi:polysaccharide biosynthesis/export family protein [Sphingomonas sp. ID0503]|uniref:polysaccharide biosynthesis/export family protein n=1 Tax=Sphingomonas sp. ID0503 TaxID=3399691 RepID=UPI003AFB33C2